MITFAHYRKYGVLSGSKMLVAFILIYIAKYFNKNLQIWANVSEVERPHQLDWNIGKSKTWLPLFSTPMPDDKIPCVQNEIKR
jgi:hypothetical protein